MDLAYIEEYELYELRHWWHVARREIIESALRRSMNRIKSRPIRWLDAGCGTGVLLESFREIPAENKLGIELDAASAARARTRGLDVRVPTGVSWDFREYGSFELVTLCDVIEHVEDDHAAIAAVRESVVPGGIVLVTVPALMSLWSRHDVINHHYRRYERAQLAQLFPQADWSVLQLSYFSSFLFPLIWSVRKLKNFRERCGGDVGPDKAFGPRLIDQTLLAIFRGENWWLRSATFPIGSSLLLVAQRKF